MAETAESLKLWLDINFPKKLPFEVVDTTGVPSDTPMQPALIRYSTTDDQIYTWAIDDGIGVWNKGLGGGGKGGKYQYTNTDITEIAIGTTYVCDVSTNQIAMSFKISDPKYVPVQNDWFEVYVANGDPSLKNVTIDFNSAGFSLEGVANKNFTFDCSNTYFRFLYIDATIGWKVIPISLGSISSNGGENYINKTADFYISNNATYLVDTSLANINAIVPSDITYPYRFKIVDLKNTFATKNCIINLTTNGYKLEGVSTNLTLNVNGSVYEFVAIDSTYGFKKIKISSSDYATLSGTETLINKTINASNNTISNLGTSNFSTGVIDTDVTLASNLDTKMPTQKAVKTYADTKVKKISSSNDGQLISWSGTTGDTPANSGILATDVVTKTGTQTLTNKTLTDASTYIADDGDASKIIKFEVAGVSSNNTRILSVPDTNLTIDGIPTTWSSPVKYTQGMRVTYGNTVLQATATHTSSDFVTDVQSNKWIIVGGSLLSFAKVQMLGISTPYNGMRIYQNNGYATGEWKYDSSVGAWIPQFTIQNITVIQTAQTKPTTDGNYIFLVTPTDGLPSGCSIGDICEKIGSLWYRDVSFANAPSTITSGSGSSLTTWKKEAGTWSTKSTSFVVPTASQTLGLGVGYPLQFNSPTVTGNIPFSSNTWTLTAGKTYELKCAVYRAGSAGSELVFQWYSNTVGYIGVSGDYYSNGENRNNIAYALYTPTTDVQVQLLFRMVSSVTQIDVSITDGRSPWASIIQVG